MLKKKVYVCLPDPRSDLENKLFFRQKLEIDKEIAA